MVGLAVIVLLLAGFAYLARWLMTDVFRQAAAAGAPTNAAKDSKSLRHRFDGARGRWSSLDDLQLARYIETVRGSDEPGGLR